MEYLWNMEYSKIIYNFLFIYFLQCAWRRNANKPLDEMKAIVILMMKSASLTKITQVQWTSKYDIQSKLGRWK